jgi:hypothetical protein
LFFLILEDTDSKYMWSDMSFSESGPSVWQQKIQITSALSLNPHHSRSFGTLSLQGNGVRSQYATTHMLEQEKRRGSTERRSSTIHQAPADSSTWRRTASSLQN